MAASEFLSFAIDPGSNVMTQVDYDALSARDTGFIAGVAPSAQLNKVWRQSTFVAAAIAQFVVDLTGLDAPDDGDLAGFLAKLKLAIAGSPAVTRIITAAGPQAITTTDVNVIVNQTIAAPITLNLPATPASNQRVTIVDGKRDASTNNITVNGNGHNINGSASFIINQDGQGLGFLWDNTNSVWVIV